MASRSMWRGGVSIGMVTFPIAVYKATDDRGGIRLNILHTCGQRINERKFCPEHGEVTDTVKGYEVGRGEFIQLTEEELDNLRLESGKALIIEQFVPAGSVPYAKAQYYLGTDKVGAAAYVLMRDTMLKLNVEALTKVSFRGREQLATIVANPKTLVLTTHFWPDEVRSDDGLVPEVPERSQAEQTMARNLLKGMTSEFDPSTQQDVYAQALVSLIEDKKAGRVIAPAPSAPSAPTPDLMSVLAASLEAAKPKKRGKAVV